MNKKGSFDKLIGFAIAIAVLVTVMVAMFLVLAQGRNQLSDLSGTNTLEYNATTTTVEAAGLIPSFMPIVILAGIGAVCIGIIAVFKSRG